MIDLAISPAIIKIVATLVPKIAGFVSDKTGKALAEISIDLGRGMQTYLQNILEKTSKVKTIINSNIPIDLMSIYVNSFLGKDKNIYRDDDIFINSNDVKYHVITGNAGSGKSMLMKYLVLKCITERSDILPVYMDLRDLNGKKEMSVVNYLFESFQRFSSYSSDDFLYMLSSGMICVFLDGFDEIDYDKRSDVTREIIGFSDKYQKTNIFVSSRPDNSFSGWYSFHVFHVCELNESQVEMLIKKIPYDDSVKDRLLKNIGKGDFRSHSYLLKNPLLVMIVLLTTSRASEIPAKTHLLYDSAFHTLFNRHDAAKSGFQRMRLVDLPVDDYQKIFSCFCAISYIRENFNFSETEALTIIERSSDRTRVSVKKEKMLEDLWRCSSMLVLDGIQYTFVHRSFQEYFVSYYLMKINPEQIINVHNKISIRSFNDNVLGMMYEMDSDRFEELWVFPALKKIRDTLKRIDINCVSDCILQLYGTDEVYIDKNRNVFPVYMYGHECSSLLFSLEKIWDFEIKLDEYIRVQRSDFLKAGPIPVPEIELPEIENAIVINGHEHLTVDSTDDVWLIRTTVGERFQVMEGFIESLLVDIEFMISSRKKSIEDFS
jgi:hypothetical protein